jgi:hypothetical protein
MNYNEQILNLKNDIIDSIIDLLNANNSYEVYLDEYNINFIGSNKYNDFVEYSVYKIKLDESELFIHVCDSVTLEKNFMSTAYDYYARNVDLLCEIYYSVKNYFKLKENGIDFV